MPNFLVPGLEIYVRDLYGEVVVKDGFETKKKALETGFLRPKEKLGGDLLSHTLVCSTIGDKRLDF